MDASLCNAAQAGNIKELYRLIQRNGNVLRKIDEVEFIESPLHIAAAAGCIDFAMEIMSLKPSFARKLNPDGLSPMHLAVMKGHTEMALRFLEIDRGLIRMRGKKGKTPLYHICKQGNPNGLLQKLLEACPESIRDVTTKNQTGLHVAVEKNKLDVVKVLVQALRNTDYCREVVDRKDQDGNTALHIAARNNQPQILKLLLTCKADKHVTNHSGLTAMKVAEQLGNKECILILLGSFIPGFTPYLHNLQTRILTCTKRASKFTFQGMDNISGDDRNALLVILALLLTAAYQTSVSPPGGVWQDNDSSPSNSTYKLGKSVMSELDFLKFYIPTSAVFMVSIFLTLCLLKPYPRGYRATLQILLTFLAICFDESFKTTAPTYKASEIIHVFYFFIFILMVFMCSAYKVSNTSVFMLGCCLFPRATQHIHILTTIVLGFWLFYYLCDKLWKGIFFLIACSIFPAFSSGSVMIPWTAVIAVTIWCFIKLCQFCIKQYNVCRYKENFLSYCSS